MKASRLDKSRQKIQAMFTEISQSYDLSNSVLSLGLHHIWKKKLVAKVLAKTKKGKVLDVCTGTGDILKLLHAQEINCFGIDFTFPMLQVQRLNSTTPCCIAQADALSLPFPDQTFDVVTVSYGIRNFESLESGLKEILRVLQPGGSLLVLEFGRAPNGLIGKIIRTYEKFIVPFIGGLISGRSAAYKYLAQSSDAFPSGDQLIGICQKIGFSHGSYVALTFGATFLYEINLIHPDNC